MSRVIAYIDGFNLYFGMRRSKLHRFYWLNLCAVASGLLKPDQRLIKTKYFTSRVTSPDDKRKRQSDYLEALGTLPDLEIFEGLYEGEIEPCEKCGHMIYLHSEKMTDVNIAIEIAKDAYADNFDTALLITGDGDQTPTVRMVKALFPKKRVISAFPPNRVSQHLRKTAHGFVHITEKILAAAALPEAVTKADGYSIRRPKHWA